MIASGTVADFMTGHAAAELQQWRNLWQHIDGFRFRPEIRAIWLDPAKAPYGGAARFGEGFRTPAHAYTCDLRWPPSKNLHHDGRSITPRKHPNADVQPSVAVGARDVRSGAWSGTTRRFIGWTNRACRR
jgi:hypothetical protein